MTSSVHQEQGEELSGRAAMSALRRPRPLGRRLRKPVGSAVIMQARTLRAALAAGALGISASAPMAHAEPSSPPADTPAPLVDGAAPSLLAAPGYSGLMNTPTADVTPFGSLRLGVVDSNPEMERTIHVGGFGSFLVGATPLPGLEGTLRLAFEGDPGCSFFRGDCPATIRDLSVSARYTLPVVLPLGTRLAVGVNDVGGAATHFRQLYAVATSRLGPLSGSVGYARREAEGRGIGLMDGLFGSAAWRPTRDWTVAVEHDSREVRAGTVHRFVLNDALTLQLGLSRKLTETTPQQAWQLMATVDVGLGAAPSPPEPFNLDIFAGLASASSDPGTPAHTLAQAGAAAPGAQGAAPPSQRQEPSARNASAVADALVAKGFARVRVRAWRGADGAGEDGAGADGAGAGEAGDVWEVEAEPRAWRRSRLEAVGAALGAWLESAGRDARDGEVILTLTFQRLPVLHVAAHVACLRDWVEDAAACPQADAVRFAAPYGLPKGLAQRTAQAADIEVMRADNTLWVPQLEVGPALRTFVGTEVGLVDAALALELGVEVQLLPGVAWQALASVPAMSTNNFAPGEAYASSKPPDAGLDVAVLTAWAPLPWGLAAQGQVGSLNRDHLGAQADVSWLIADGRVRLGGSLGGYQHRPSGAYRTPALGSARVSVWPGTWHMDATGGLFLNGDVGWSVTSRHWFGQVALAASYRDTAYSGTSAALRRRFLGFSISLPLDGARAHAVGPATLRGRDRWTWGLETKVGETDNVITAGYGIVPRVRHGLWTDVLDHDRGAVADLDASVDVLRALVRQHVDARER